MNNFKKIDDNNFVIIVDMPLGNTQCQILFDLLDAKLPGIVDVTHNHYGSFKVEMEDGVKHWDTLYQDVWEAGEDLFFAMHQLEMFGENAIENELDIQDSWDWCVDLHKECGYEYDVNDIIETVEYAGFEKTKIEQIAMLHKLAA